ncbi:phosphopantothenoylcysteine decarboxylase [Myxococcota bacterium]|nr:phosphopantothenoylcysteine decarboxylase [Myxococcota bacterium]
MARVLLGVTGSVAAIRAPELAHALVAAGHEVQMMATASALRFFDPLALPNNAPLYTDADEWRFPRSPDGRWSRDDAVLHIELRAWAELLLLAPLDAHSLGKLALGLSDNLLTCVFRAWEHPRPVVLAPAMNTLMWESPQTARHLRALLEDHGVEGAALPTARRPEPYLAHFGGPSCPHMQLVGPVEKRLACGDFGVGGMSSVPELVEAVARALSASPAQARPASTLSSKD